MEGRRADAQDAGRLDDAPKNPYFARAAVNRMWAHFFGIGLIDPVDEMVGTETRRQPSRAARRAGPGVRRHRFDLKFLIRAITASKAYQRTSLAATAGQDDPRLFARMPLRGLTAEQLFDSLADGDRLREANANTARFVVVGGPGSPRQEFVNRFNEQSDKATESQTSILQALSLMNGKLIADATSLDRSETLAAIVDAPFMDTAAAHRDAVPGDPVAPAEGEGDWPAWSTYVEGAGKAGPDASRNRREALADVFWALLNSSEFILNH